MNPTLTLTRRRGGYGIHKSCSGVHLEFPSPPLGAERQGEVGDSRALADAHLTLPRLWRGPLPLPPQAGGEGQFRKLLDNL